MKLYLAPMEGLTGYVYRNAWHKYFRGIDRYFTPFLANKKLSAREKNDILPEHNEGMDVVPQILTNNAGDFLLLTKELREYGYDHVNLNLGCPSGTVVSKGRGAGFLAFPEALDAFLEKIFSESGCKISIKTRIGMESPDEWEELLAVFEKYPLEELIIHPRIRNDFYKNTPRMEAYRYAAEHSRHSLCYNGDIFSGEAYDGLLREFPATEKVMLGRGVLQNPALPEMLRGERGTLTIERMRAFHEELLAGYAGTVSGDRNVLFKMKEFWSYFAVSFTNPEKYMKNIRKSQHLAEYRAAVNALFAEQEILMRQE